MAPEFTHGKWNHYTCQLCKGVTIAKHVDDGVTPFILGCKATPGCLGHAMSSMYRCSQAEDQRADVEWYRPATLEEAIQAINDTIPEGGKPWALDHWQQGGCLMRELPRVTH